jgi:hypothetical protein
MVRKVNNVLGVACCSESRAIMMDKEQLNSHIIVRFEYHFFVEHVHFVMMNSTNEMSSHSQLSPKHQDLLNTPITSYRKMKTIFDQPYVCAKDLFSLRKLMAAINYLVDNKASGIKAREEE